MGNMLTDSAHDEHEHGTRRATIDMRARLNNEAIIRFRSKNINLDGQY